MGDGAPEESTRRLGDEIARLRNDRGWTRTQLVVRTLYMLGPDHPFTEVISENWLNRLESGRLVKVPHQAIEIICKALECNDGEKIAVMMYADRNPLADQDGISTPEAEMLGRIMVHLYRTTDIPFMLGALRGDRRASALTTEEIDEIAKAIVAVLANKRKVSTTPPSPSLL